MISTNTEMTLLRITWYISVFGLSLNAHVGNPRLNINPVYEKLTSSHGKSENFGQSLALNQKTIYVGSPGEDVIYSCQKGGSSCDKISDFNIHPNTTKYAMLGLAMATSKTKIFTCAPLTNFRNYLQDDEGLGKMEIEI